MFVLQAFFTQLYRAFYLLHNIEKLRFLAKNHHKKSILNSLIWGKPRSLFYNDHILPKAIVERDIYFSKYNSSNLVETIYFSKWDKIENFSPESSQKINFTLSCIRTDKNIFEQYFYITWCKPWISISLFFHI